MTKSFKDRHLELQHIVRELLQVRSHNLACAKEGNHGELLHFAEGALVLIALERFVRIVLGDAANEKDTLYNLLEKAVSMKLLILPWDDQRDGINKLKALRNAVMHANYEQAAQLSGCATFEDFFRSSQYISAVECLFRVTDDLMKQVDIATGRPKWQL